MRWVDLEPGDMIINWGDDVISLSAWLLLTKRRSSVMSGEHFEATWLDETGTVRPGSLPESLIPFSAFIVWRRP